MELELAERGWGQWRDAISKEIGDRTGLGPAEVAAILTETISALSVFCDLLAHVAMNLEGDVDIERARRYKTNATAAHDDLVAALVEASSLSVVEIQTLVATTISMAASLWQWVPGGDDQPETCEVVVG